MAIKDLATEIWELCDREEPFELSHIEPLVHDIQTRVPDTSKIEDLLDWRPQVELTEGLRRTIAWIRDAVTAELRA